MELDNDLHATLAEILCILMASRFDRLNNIPQVRHLLHKLAQEHVINPDTIGCVAYLLRTDITRGRRIADCPSSQGAEIRSLIERLKNAEAQARIPPFTGMLGLPDLAHLIEIMRQPEDMVIQSGPTWSGMSTSLGLMHNSHPAFGFTASHLHAGDELPES